MRAVVLVLLAACSPVVPAHTDEPCPTARPDLTDVLETAVTANAGYGGGILRVACHDGTVVWEGAAGTVARGSSTAISPGDRFEIQSVTKALTAALVLLLVEDGLVLDEPLGQILTPAQTHDLLVVDGHDYGPELTIRQLLHHTAGLPDYWNDGPFAADGMNAFQRAYSSSTSRMFTPDELLAYARELAPIGPPDAAYHYSDTGYVLLGLAIEARTGTPYHRAMRDRIFTPLGMADTYVTFHDSSTVPVVAWYDEHELVAGTPHQSADWAGGGLVSTSADLARFLRALADGDLFRDPATLATMQTWTPVGDAGIDYGYGLFRVDFAAYGEPAKGRWWGHDGYGNAFMYAVAPGVIVTGTLNNAQADFGVMVEKIQETLLR